ncbi:MAG: putative Ig domain-containing protein [Patescibacteria group bacterium]
MKVNIVRFASLWVLALVLLLTACVSSGGGGGDDSTNYIPPIIPPADNQPPVITSLPITTAISGELYGYALSATDSDNDVLTYGLDVGPAGMTINASTGLVSWLPNDTQVGEQQVKLRVSDGKIVVWQEYTLKVTLPPPNVGPSIISGPVTVATAEVEYTYTVGADDPEGDILTYSLVTFPTGMTIDSASGKITWTSTSAQIGNYKVEVSVTDGEFSDTQKFAIRVIPSDNGITFQRGCTLTSWWYNDYQNFTSNQTVDKMKADGCEVIAVLVTQYQDAINSTTIYPISSKTPSDAGLAQIITYIHDSGLSVMLKPHVDVQSGAWRGEITFSSEADWQAWFASYRQFLNHYLDLAEANQVEIFVIGTEFKATEHRETNWRDEIANARTSFSGQLTYGANHDSYFNVVWWDALDFIGVDAYFPLTSSYSPTVEELKIAWQPYISALQNFAEAYGQDIVFTEFGYQSLNGTNISPWWAPSGTIDLQEQADCYQAIMESAYNQPWFKGMYGWMWYWNPAQDINRFDVWNKPAELILRDWYAGY